MSIAMFLVTNIAVIFLLIFKFASPRTIACIVSTANKCLVGTFNNNWWRNEKHRYFLHQDPIQSFTVNIKISQLHIELLKNTRDILYISLYFCSHAIDQYYICNFNVRHTSETPTRWEMLLNWDIAKDSYGTWRVSFTEKMDISTFSYLRYLRKILKCRSKIKRKLFNNG